MDSKVTIRQAAAAPHSTPKENEQQSELDGEKDELIAHTSCRSERIKLSEEKGGRHNRLF